MAAEAGKRAARVQKTGQLAAGSPAMGVGPGGVLKGHAYPAARKRWKAAGGSRRKAAVFELALSSSEELVLSSDNEEPKSSTQDAEHGSSIDSD